MKPIQLGKCLIVLLLLSSCTKQFTADEAMITKKTPDDSVILPAFVDYGIWTLRDYHSPQYGRAQCSFVINEKAYIFGWGDLAHTNQLWEYDDNTITWVKKADFPGPGRVMPMAFAIGSKGYIACGANTYGGPFFYNDVWEYNVATNQWTQKNDFPGSIRHNGVGFAINGKGYIGLGGILPTCKKDLWEYNPISDSWTQKTSLPGNKRVGAFSFVLNDKAYVGGGFYYDQTASPAVYTYLKDFWQYNPATDSWQQKSDYLGGRVSEAAAFSLSNGLGFVGTGYDNATQSNTKNFYRYDPSGDYWFQLDDYGGYARQSAVGFSLNGFGFIGFGETTSGSGETALWRWKSLE